MTSYCKILVVDDEIITRQGMKYLIDWEKEGFEIVGETSNGKEALELIDKLRPDIVISDIVMPVMDGINLTQLVHERYPQIRMIILSGYSGFEYVKSSFQNGAVDYILKPTLNPQSLLESLKKVASHIPNMALAGARNSSVERTVNQFLAGFEYEANSNRLHEIFEYPCFMLLGMDVSYVYGSAGDRMPEQRRVLEENAADFLDGVLYQVVVNQQVLLLILNFEESQQADLVQRLRRMVAYMADDGGPLFYVYSEVFSDIAQLKTVYNERFLDYTRQQFYHQREHILSVDAIRSDTRALSFDSKAYNQRLKSLALQEALDSLATFIERAVEKHAPAEVELKVTTQNALYTFLSMLEELQFDLDTLHRLKRNCLVTINSIKYAQDFLTTMQALLADFSALVSRYQGGLDDSIIKKITAYISAHYMEPLTLTDLAKQFNFNYYYLSSYFSTHTREGFSDYLNQIRINKAVDLLRQTSVPISQVSARVGYSDHSYFCKVFKKLTGSTPSDYRRRVMYPVVESRL